MGVVINSTGLYMRLDSWRMAKIIQLATFSFCRRFLNRNNDPDGKQFGQTTGAARAVPANIAEGSSRHQTSYETEMKLLDVARASLSEVIDDMSFFLMFNHQVVWAPEDPRAIEVRNLKLDPLASETVSLHEITVHLNRQRERFAPWIENDDPDICANAIIILCLRVAKMLTKQLQKRLDEFSQQGGFRENMTDTRIQTKKNQNQQEGAPRCPVCGAVMWKRTAKAGVNAGKQFWSCSNYRSTGCKGLIPID